MFPVYGQATHIIVQDLWGVHVNEIRPTVDYILIIIIAFTDYL